MFDEIAQLSVHFRAEFGAFKVHDVGHCHIFNPAVVVVVEGVGYAAGILKHCGEHLRQFFMCICAAAFAIYIMEQIKFVVGGQLAGLLFLRPVSMEYPKSFTKLFIIDAIMSATRPSFTWARLGMHTSVRIFSAR